RTRRTQTRGGGRLVLIDFRKGEQVKGSDRCGSAFAQLRHEAILEGLAQQSTLIDRENGEFGDGVAMVLRRFPGRVDRRRRAGTEQGGKGEEAKAIEFHKFIRWLLVRSRSYSAPKPKGSTIPKASLRRGELPGAGAFLRSVRASGA